MFARFYSAINEIQEVHILHYVKWLNWLESPWTVLERIPVTIVLQLSKFSPVQYTIFSVHWITQYEWCTFQIFSYVHILSPRSGSFRCSIFHFQTFLIDRFKIPAVDKYLNAPWLAEATLSARVYSGSSRVFRVLPRIPQASAMTSLSPEQVCLSSLPTLVDILPRFSSV